MKIIFCITCKGRLEHLKKTLPENLADNADFLDCKFVLMDYNSQDGLQEYIKSVHALNLDSGYLSVYTHMASGAFHVSHAKNMAARCAILEGADILVTLDADNYTGPGFTQFIADRFREAGPWAGRPAIWPGVFLCPNFPLIKSLPYGSEFGRPDRGYAGRFAIHAKDFVKMGGYDESFNTWHGEDVDMIARLGRLGYSMRHFENSQLKTIPHGPEVRFKEYPHAKQFENEHEWKVIDSRTTTVVNYGKFGVGTVYKNYDFNKPIELEPVPTRIFGIGMHKTGTTTLHHALQILGYDSFHWGTGEAPIIWQEMTQEGRSKKLEQWYALSDLPIPLLYKQLDYAYPGSKFILTLRDEADWLKSVEKLWDHKSNPTRWLWDVYPFTNRIHRELYGQKHFDKEVMLARYRRHNAEVMEYFRNRSEDLLVMNIDTRLGWSWLCDFLRVEHPDVPYPNSNMTSANEDLIGNRDYKTLAQSGVGYCDPEITSDVPSAGDTWTSRKIVVPRIRTESELLAVIPSRQDAVLDFVRRNYRAAIIFILAILLGMIVGTVLAYLTK